MSLQQSIDYGPLTGVYATQVIPIGTLRFDGVTSKYYRFCLVVDAASFAAIVIINNAAAPVAGVAGSGYPYAVATAVQWKVTADATGGSALAALEPVGVIIGKATALLPYAWVEVGSSYTYVWSGAEATAGNCYVKPDTNEDGEVLNATAADDQNILGFAPVAIVAGSVGIIKLKTPI